jgi:hypothetical protein
MNYLLTLAQKDLKTKLTEEEYFLADFPNGIGVIKNVKLSLFEDFLQQIVSIKSPVCKELQTIAESMLNPNIPIIYDNQKYIRFTLVEKLFWVDLAQKPPALNFEPLLKSLDAKTFNITTGPLSITFTIDENKELNSLREIVYRPYNKTLFSVPKFMFFNSQKQDWDEAKIEFNHFYKIINNKSIYIDTCICGLKGSFAECCKELFFNPTKNVFYGFTEIEIINFLDEHREGLEYPFLESINKVIFMRKNAKVELETMIEEKKDLSLILNKLALYPIIDYDEIQYPVDNILISNIENEINTYTKSISLFIWAIKDSDGTCLKVSTNYRQKIAQLHDWLVAEHTRVYYQDIILFLDLIFKNYSLEEIIEPINMWTVINSKRQLLVKQSLTLFAQGFQEEASYVIFPQIEPILRDISKAMQIPVVQRDKYKLGNFNYLMLSQLITNVFSKRKDHLAIRELFKLTLTDYGNRGLNLRNEIAHSFSNKEFSKNEFYIGFFLILVASQGFKFSDY